MGLTGFGWVCQLGVQYTLWKSEELPIPFVEAIKQKVDLAPKSANHSTTSKGLGLGKASLGLSHSLLSDLRMAICCGHLPARGCWGLVLIARVIHCNWFGFEALAFASPGLDCWFGSRKPLLNQTTNPHRQTPIRQLEGRTAQLELKESKESASL